MYARERPEVEEERAQISGQLNETVRNLEEGELKILEVLSTSKGNILEDENAIKNLSSSKVVMNELAEKEQMAAATFERISKSRQEYVRLTNYAVTLFFTGESMSSLNHMYQYSLSWFINLFCSSIDAADKSENLKERLRLIQDHFLQVCSVCSLFSFSKIILNSSLFMKLYSLFLSSRASSRTWSSVSSRRTGSSTRSSSPAASAPRATRSSAGTSGARSWAAPRARSRPASSWAPPGSRKK